jgi:hypothetical protein
VFSGFADQPGEHSKPSPLDEKGSGQSLAGMMHGIKGAAGFSFEPHSVGLQILRPFSGIPYQNGNQIFIPEMTPPLHRIPEMEAFGISRGADRLKGFHGHRGSPGPSNRSFIGYDNPAATSGRLDGGSHPGASTANNQYIRLP